MKALQQVKAAIRNGPFVWPGGYPLLAIMEDGENLCIPCLHREFRSIVRATLRGYWREWVLAGVDVYWEGPPVQCAHCGTTVESAYGDPNAEE